VVQEGWKKGWIFAAALVALMGARGTEARGELPIQLTQAAEQGTFNVGAGTANLSRNPGGQSLRLAYRLPKGTAAGVWSKAFPDPVGPASVDVVRLDLHLDPSSDPRQVEGSLELKGSTGVQRIPLRLDPAGTLDQQPVNWPAIGALSEVVVALSRVGEAEVASGSIDFAIALDRTPLLDRLATSPPARVAASWLLALLGWLVLGAIRAVVPPSSRPPRPASGLARDLVFGVGSVGILAVAVAVFRLGQAEPGWGCLAVALGGLTLAEWWTFGLSGRHLTPAEAFRDLLVTGLAAASSSPLAILQAPASPAELLALSQTVAAVVVLIHHFMNARSIATTGRHLGPVSASLIAATPYAVGSLTLLEPGVMTRVFGALWGGSWSVDILARVALISGFNQLVAAGLGLATGRGLIRSTRAHAWFLGVAVAAVASPWLAAYGSGAGLLAWPAAARPVATVILAMLAEAGLWGEVYLITGLLMDAIHGRAPTSEAASGHVGQGFKKAMIYSGTFLGILQILGALGSWPPARSFAAASPLLACVLLGTCSYPLIKTIFATFDGSKAFFRRTRRSYADPSLIARGAVIGLGLGLGLTLALSGRPTGERALYGLLIGAGAYAGVDALGGLLALGSPSWRLILVRSLLGGAIGAAVGFYLDAAQVSVIVAKFHQYLAIDGEPRPFDVYPLLSKWGRIDLGTVSGGVTLLFDESLAGVISWAVPAWLFAINRTFLAAYFRRELAPVRDLVTPEGRTQLVQNMFEVLRWGLWMSPIINSFLRPMGEPTWYNQDGAIRTGVAVVRDLTMTPEAFREWSLQVFIALLAYDSVRILIWLDHMGLRVATLVNLSFLGMDRLDERLARFVSPQATARCIPEGVKRFATWAPLLLPYYIPRNRDWDEAWSRSQTLQRQAGPGLVDRFLALPRSEQALCVAGMIMLAAFVSWSIRFWRARRSSRTSPEWSLTGPAYEVIARGTGELIGRIPGRDYDVTRRSYDHLDPAGRALFLVEGETSWPILGNYPSTRGPAVAIRRDDQTLVFESVHQGIESSLKVRLAGGTDPAEVWELTLVNLSHVHRKIHAVPYLEWVLNKPDADRGHTQYNRLFAELEYAAGLHAVLAYDKHAKAMGILASDRRPEGFLTARVDFIGRARSLWRPRAVETLAFQKHQDTDAHPTFDPIASLLLPVELAPSGTSTVRFLVGLVADKPAAIDLVARHLEIPTALHVSKLRRRKSAHPIGHGEPPREGVGSYYHFSDDGRTLILPTPFTPRPFDHPMSNAHGHILSVTNRGIQTSASGNAQQNRLTPDWPDTVTREVPPEAFYLLDLDTNDWSSPTYQPLADPEASYTTEFSVNGTATYHMSKGSLETELTLFVPPDDPLGVYHWIIRNVGTRTLRLRAAAYFQIVLAAQPEHAGPLLISRSPDMNALFFENPRNIFRTGPAFAAVSFAPERVETARGRFFGPARDVARPSLVATDEPSPVASPDDRPVAAFLTTLTIPPGAEVTLVTLLGQADDRAAAEAILRKYQTVDKSESALDETERWWLGLMDTVKVETASIEFNRYLDWLKYQALAERIWSRRGFYQASGAFGFRDQLQDSVNLLWMDPAVARRQILLHASQQFLEGDVVHWFHRLQDGRTGFAARTHASDNLLWLPWAVVEYLGATGDASLLDEHTSYLESELPFEPLPAGKAGMGFDPLRSSKADSILDHCMKAVDLVLYRRIGSHGIPLMGTGDWNDGLDEIGSEGRGESVWLGFFLIYILKRMISVIQVRDGAARAAVYEAKLSSLAQALETTWRGDRYLRAFHDDGTEIGVKGSGVWEIDALTAAWAVMSGINLERGRVVFATALEVLETEKTILLGWPPLREDTHPYLGRSSAYPEGVRENGMYCHGVQWLVGAARILADQATSDGNLEDAEHYRETAYRLWMKIAAISHTTGAEIETYGGQPNKQAADMVTTFDPGRMIWNGYTGAAGWMFRQAIEGVLGLRLDAGKILAPQDPSPPSELGSARVVRDLATSPFAAAPNLRPPAQTVIANPTNQRD
jgi:cyclic beta-1,2-glucan synthetase